MVFVLRSVANNGISSYNNLYNPFSFLRTFKGKDYLTSCKTIAESRYSYFVILNNIRTIVIISFSTSQQP